MPKQVVNGVSFEYELIGKKIDSTPIVLISGYAVARSFWAPLVNILSKERQVLVFENQGFDATIDNGAPLTLNLMAANIFDLITSLGLLNPVIVGFALGAGIAQKIALDHPNQLKHLILLGAVMKFNESAKAVCEKFCEFRKAGDFPAYAKLLYETIFSASFKDMLSLEAFSASFIPTIGMAQTEKNQRRQLEVFKAFDSRSWAMNIKTPTTVIALEEDYFALPSESKLLKESIGAHADFILLPGAGHAALATHLKIIGDIINEKCTITQ